MQRFARESFVRPPLRLAEGRELAAHAHAMLDVSDGIAVDAGHLARRSGCRVVIELERVPLAAGAELDDLGFGEDYELLAAVDDPRPVHGRSAAARTVEGVLLTLERRAVRARRLGALPLAPRS